MLRPYSKTEFIILGTRQQLAKVNIGSSRVSPTPIVRNLGAWFDANMTMASHITKTCATAFYYLHNIRRIRKYLSRQCTETLIHSFISSRLDYCNSLLYRLPDIQINQLQRVQNSCARLVCNALKYCHITPLLIDLHWLPVRFRIDFKILLITYKILNGLAPLYLCQLIKTNIHLNIILEVPGTTCSLVTRCVGLKSRWVIGHLSLLHPNYGTLYH